MAVLTTDTATFGMLETTLSIAVCVVGDLTINSKPKDRSISTSRIVKNWTLGRDNYYTFGVEEKKSEEALPSTELIEQVIEYARELEMIV
ncbi:26S proteasome non-ATPase regulatory subunit 8 [Homalodisca vitripennis]|nr:26S proteasome non-ATPase regulatory subunit 8 [Homalodisca vitripennis]